MFSCVAPFVRSAQQIFVLCHFNTTCVRRDDDDYTHQLFCFLFILDCMRPPTNHISHIWLHEKIMLLICSSANKNHTQQLKKKKTKDKSAEFLTDAHIIHERYSAFERNRFLFSTRLEWIVIKRQIHAEWRERTLEIIMRSLHRVQTLAERNLYNLWLWQTLNCGALKRAKIIFTRGCGHKLNGLLNTYYKLHIRNLLHT